MHMLIVHKLEKNIAYGFLYCYIQEHLHFEAFYTTNIIKS